jgi:hypothetical protein
MKPLPSRSRRTERDIQDDPDRQELESDDNVLFDNGEIDYTRSLQVLLNPDLQLWGLSQPAPNLESDRESDAVINAYTKDALNNPQLAALRQDIIPLPAHLGKRHRIQHNDNFDEYNSGMTVEDTRSTLPSRWLNFPTSNKIFDYVKSVWDVFRDRGYRLYTDFMWPNIAREPQHVVEHILPLPIDLPPLPSLEDQLLRNHFSPESFKVVPFDHLFDPDAPVRTRAPVYNCNTGKPLNYSATVHLPLT